MFVNIGIDRHQYCRKLLSAHWNVSTRTQQKNVNGRVFDLPHLQTIQIPISVCNKIATTIMNLTHQYTLLSLWLLNYYTAIESEDLYQPGAEVYRSVHLYTFLQDASHTVPWLQTVTQAATSGACDGGVSRLFVIFLHSFLSPITCFVMFSSHTAKFRFHQASVPRCKWKLIDIFLILLGTVITGAHQRHFCYQTGSGLLCSLFAINFQLKPAAFAIS